MNDFFLKSPCSVVDHNIATDGSEIVDQCLQVYELSFLDYNNK